MATLVDGQTLEEGVARAAASAAGGHWATRVGTDLQDLIAEHDVVAVAQQGGGPVLPTENRTRVVVQLYAARYTPMWQAAADVTERLLDTSRRFGNHQVDRARCESDFAERPYTEGTRVVVSTWVFTSRRR